MRRRSWGKWTTGSVREIVFGLEDSLVSTVGAVAGVAVGSGDRFVVILSGMVLVAVEAISMAAGSYLSTKSAQEVSREREKQDYARILQERVSDDESLHDLFKRKGFSSGEIATALEAFGRERRMWLREVRRTEYRALVGGGVSPAWAALVMGVAYVVGGVVTFSPYFFLPMPGAMLVSILIAFTALFLLGVWKGALAERSRLRSGAEMLAVSLVAAGLGVVIGRLVSSYFSIPVL